MGGSRPRCFSGEASKKIFEDNVQDGGGLKIFLSKCPNLFVFGNEVLNF